MILVEASFSFKNCTFVDILPFFKLVFSCCFYPDAEAWKGVFTLCPRSEHRVGSAAVFLGTETSP
jgi:hypothetical protein